MTDGKDRTDYGCKMLKITGVEMRRMAKHACNDRLMLCVSAAAEPDLQRCNDHLQEPDFRVRPVTSRRRHSDVTTTTYIVFHLPLY